MDVELGDPGLQHPRAHGRIRSAQATLAAIEPRKHLFGITRVADVTGLDRVGIPVAIAIRPSARSVAVSQGKGIDLASAKVSALMEAIEVWHAENIEAPLVLASIADVAGRSCEVARLPIGRGFIPTGSCAAAVDRRSRPRFRTIETRPLSRWCTPTTHPR